MKHSPIAAGAPHAAPAPAHDLAAVPRPHALPRHGGTVAAAALAALCGALAPQLFGVLGLALGCAPLLVAALLGHKLGPACLCVPAALCAFAPSAPVPTPPRAGPVLLVGRVVSRCIVDDLRGDVRCVVGRGHARALCVFARGTALAPGDEVRALGTLARKPSGLAVITVPDGALLAVRRARSLTAAAEGLRLTMHGGLVRAVPGREGRLLAQLVLGHGGEIDADLAEAHRATGLSHLLAVSGAHVSLLAGMLTAVLQWTSRRLHTPWVVLGAVLLYGTMTGLDPPVARALIGFALMLVAQRSGRRLPAVAVLAAPGLLTALLMPSDTKTASFALSYAAVAGLLLAPLPARPCSVARVLAYAFVASFAATLATAPITLHLFGQLAPWTILATPLLSPLVALMLGLGLVVGLLSSLGADVAMLALLLRAATSLYATAVEHLAELPGTPILAVCQPPAAVLVAAVLLCGLAVCAWPNRASAAAVCTLLSLPHFVPWPQRATPGLHLLDVGHGQACLLTLPQRQRVLVDCGSLHQPVLAAHAVVRALAPSRHLDLVVLTHADADHTHGLPFLLRRVRVAAVAMPKEMETHAICAEVARSGARVCLVAPGERSAPWPGLTLARPLAPLPARSNDAGLWVHADLGGFNACLPGDAEEPGVHAWLASPWQQRADVLVLPHHGRAHGAVGALLERVRPALALVSGGVHDAPAPQAVVARRRGITALETAQVGDVRVDASEQMRVQTARPVPVWPVAK